MITWPAGSTRSASLTVSAAPSTQRAQLASAGSQRSSSTWSASPAPRPAISSRTSPRVTAGGRGGGRNGGAGITTLTGAPGSICRLATPSSSAWASTPRSPGSQARRTVSRVPASTRPSGVATRRYSRLLKLSTRPSPSSVTADAWMPSWLSSTLAAPTARSPAGSTAEIRAVSVTRPCRSSGTAGSARSNRPLAEVWARRGSSWSCHPAGAGQSPVMPQATSSAAAATGAPEL
ncbi:MAG TPA: hypothetical protein VHT91_00985 [Kofleriaceae bacterium]|nr:hypothetical protein [Kofleriaceae bacterium]